MSFKKHLFLFGKPKEGRINPHLQQDSMPTNPESPVFSDPNCCPLCCLTFDKPGELIQELKKDGYGDCHYCPRCGRKL